MLDQKQQGMERRILELRRNFEFLTPGSLKRLDNVGCQCVGIVTLRQDIHGSIEVAAARLYIDKSRRIIGVFNPCLSCPIYWLASEQFQEVISKISMRVKQSTSIPMIDHLPQQTFQELALAFSTAADYIQVSFEAVDIDTKALQSPIAAPRKRPG